MLYVIITERIILLIIKKSIYDFFYLFYDYFMTKQIRISGANFLALFLKETFFCAVPRITKDDSISTLLTGCGIPCPSFIHTYCRGFSYIQKNHNEHVNASITKKYNKISHIEWPWFFPFGFKLTVWRKKGSRKRYAKPFIS